MEKNQLHQAKLNVDAETHININLDAKAMLAAIAERSAFEPRTP